MMERIGTYLFKKGFIKEDEIDVIRYAVEMIISEYLITAVVYLVLLLFGYGIEATVHLILFTYLRNYLDGYHAKTMLRCASISSILFVIGTIMDIGEYKFLLLVIDSIILLLICIKKQKIKCILISCLFSTICIVFLKQNTVNVISITAAEVIVLKFLRSEEEDSGEETNEKN